MWPKLFEARGEKYLRSDTRSIESQLELQFFTPVPDTCAYSLRQKQKLERRLENNDDGGVSVHLLLLLTFYYYFHLITTCFHSERKIGLRDLQPEAALEVTKS